MTYRVWYYEEFKEADANEREDTAWKVPDAHGILDPHVRIPCDDARDAARLFAEYFHNRRDGWECTWPLEFVVHDGEQYFLIEVERETVPEFVTGKPRPLAVEGRA